MTGKKDVLLSKLEDSTSFYVVLRKEAGFVNAEKCVEEEQEKMKQISEAVKKDQILYYFKTQWPVLLAVTFSGLIYNLGLLAGPWFEGRMTGCLVDILGGKAGYQDMLVLVTAYVMSIAIVQISRYIKRFYVRRFANNVNRDMKEILYRSLMDYPPVGGMLALHGQGEDESYLQMAMEYLKKYLDVLAKKTQARVIGPADESVSKVADIYRKVIYVRHGRKEVLDQIKERTEQYIEINRGFDKITIQYDRD